MGWYWIIIVPAAVYYGLFCLLILKQCRPASTVIEPVEPGALPEQVAAEFEKTSRELPDCSCLGTFVMGRMSHVTMYLLVSADQVSETLVSKSVTVADGGNHLRVTSHLQCYQFFDDDSALLTSNTFLDSPLCSNHQCHFVSVPPVQHVSMLRKVHKAILSGSYSARRSVSPWREDCLGWLRRESVEVNEERIRQGLEYIDSCDGERRLTLKAVLLTLHMVTWPFRPLRLAFAEWRARRLLSMLGLPAPRAKAAALKIPKPRSEPSSRTLFCPTCDYNLTGLQENRCPECGNAFDRSKVEASMIRAPQVITLPQAIALAFMPVGMLLWLPLAVLVTGKVTDAFPDYAARLLIPCSLAVLAFSWIILKESYKCSRELGRRIAVTRAVKSGLGRSGLQDRKTINSVWIAAFSVYCVLVLIALACVAVVFVAKLM